MSGKLKPSERGGIAPFPPPPHGWTCFHCGETFRTVFEGATHFGVSIDSKPGCVLRVEKSERGLLAQLREIEIERNELRVRITAARLGLDRKAEDEAVERYRATRTVPLHGQRAALSPEGTKT